MWPLFTNSWPLGFEADRHGHFELSASWNDGYGDFRGPYRPAHQDPIQESHLALSEKEKYI